MRATQLAKKTRFDADNASRAAVTKTLPAQVLIVDDYGIIALDQRRLLTELGAEAIIATTGEQALKIARQRRFDLIILDVHLRGISGLEVCRRLKQDPGLKELRVILMSAESDPLYVRASVRLGAVDYLRKPYDPEHFQSRVLRHLKPPAQTGP